MHELFCRYKILMPRNKRLHHGVRANIPVYKNFLHPQAAVCAKYPNAAKKNDMLDDLVIAIRANAGLHFNATR